MKTTNFKFAPACTIAVGILLTVLIAQVQSSAQSPTSHRIRFTHGAISKTVKVILAKRQNRPVYLVKTRAGQKMSITVTPVTGSEGIVPVITVISPSGKSSEVDHTKVRRIDVSSTEKGDYQIRVGINLMASNGTSGVCRLKVWIR